MRMIDLRDRFGRSLIAGFAASLILWSLNLFSYYVLHFSKRRYINYSAIMIFGREFKNLAEAVISSVAQIGFATGLIVIFSYTILKPKRPNYLWRGLFIGFGSWFAIMSIMYLAGVHRRLDVDFGSALSFMITSIIWGMLGAWLLRRLDEKYGV